MQAPTDPEEDPQVAAMLSVPCSRPLRSFQQPSHSLLPSGIMSPRIHRLWISEPNSSVGYVRFSANRNWIFCNSTRFHPKAAKSEIDTDASGSVREDKIPAVENPGTPSTSFLSILCPLLKFFGGGDPSLERNEFLEVATSSLSTLARLPWGSRTVPGTSNNQEATQNSSAHLQLFEFEACPFCRRVREAMTELDLSAEVYPCPKGSLRHREMVRKMGGKEQFPFLVDPNAGISMYESGEIVKYLYQQYGQGRKPSVGLLESTLFTGWMPTILRAGRGLTLWGRAKSEPPPKKLELFSYENNPYARIVREALSELELPYILRNVGEGSSNSNLLLQTSGSKKVPYLVDPNTGMQLGNHKTILSYLFGTYSFANSNAPVGDH